MPRLRPADGSGGRRARPPDPLAGGEGRSGCGALPLAGAASPLTCPPAAANPFNARVAGYARGASLTTFGFVTIVPRYLLPQVIPSHSFAALTALVVRRVRWYYGLICAPRKW
mgnify:CR=1 FL=1